MSAQASCPVIPSQCSPRSKCPWGATLAWESVPPRLPLRGRWRIAPVGIRFPFYFAQRPKAATYLCRFAAKARFDNRPNPRVRFPKGRAAALPFSRFKGKGFLRKGGNRNPPFLKWRSLVTFFRQGKKVTRRGQKERGEKKAPRGRQKGKNHGPPASPEGRSIR